MIESFYTWYKQTLRNTKYRWVIVLGTLIYLISPLDISPDFLPLIGWVDDGILATLLVTEMSQIAVEFLNKRKQANGKNATENANATDSVITVEV